MTKHDLSILSRLALVLADVHSRRILECCELNMGPLESWSKAPKGDWLRVNGLGREKAERLASAALWDAARREWDEAQAKGISLVYPGHEDYPVEFDHLHAQPALFYMRGRWPKMRKVAVVGTRLPTLYG